MVHRMQTHALASTSAGSGQSAPAAGSIRLQLPTVYRRLVAKHTGRSFREVAEVQECALPDLGPNEVLIQLKYAGINGGCETFRARGEYAFAGNKNKTNIPLGAEGSGIIAAVGSAVRSLTVGQAVACNSAASFAEYGVTQAAMCTPVAQASPEAVALVLSATCAAAALEVTATVQPGDVVLVTAAAGGTGHFAVQLAQLASARAVAVTGSEAKKQRLQQLGVERVVNYQAEDVPAVLSAEYPQGVNVVYEGVGGTLRAAILPHLAAGGRLLQVGYISEYPHAGTGAAEAANEANVPITELFWGGKSLELAEGRKIIGQVWPKDVAAIRRCKQRVFKLHEQGKLQAWVDVNHGFRGVEQIPDAVDYMLKGSHTGKVVVPL
eukprot:GHRR01010010.1.p1 GENE.GHRR01010010.1~~GHRR01010010.1.p1  ORF type:complete len:380 (+),score=128.42 GHRR01010010.1:157-1296(+)